MDIGAVREALAETLARPDVQVSPYVLSNPTPPGIQILPPSVSYNYASGLDEWVFLIQGFVPLNTDIGAQVVLDEMCAPTGSTSVKALLEADKTLGGLIDKLRMDDQSLGRMVETVNGIPVLLVEWRLTVYAR